MIPLAASKTNQLHNAATELPDYPDRENLIRESPPQFENRIMARVYVRSITRSTMYQKAPFC